MKPTNKTYRKFQGLILKSEGKTLEDELGFGCRIAFTEEEEDGGWYSVNEGIMLVTRTSPSKVYLYGTDRKSIIRRDDPHWGKKMRMKNLINTYEILGQDITLERVLSALQKAPFEKEDFFWDEGYSKNEIVFRFKRMGSFRWQLCKPAHLQEEEVLVKLIELLS